MAATITAFVLICVYLGSDARLRSGKTARQMTPDEADRKSTAYIGRMVLVCVLLLLLSPLLNRFGVGALRISPGWGWLGVVFSGLGMALRIWSTQVLGRFYTRTLLTVSDQRIVQEGPYRLIRHPGYAGSLLVWIGAGLATLNWIVFTLITLVCCLTYLYRIRSEEALLIARFGSEYEEYIQRTKRLIPYIF